MFDNMKASSTDELDAYVSASPNYCNSSLQSIKRMDDAESYSRYTKNPTASLNSRNINFKNLLLDISPQNSTKSSVSPHRTAPLSLTIPDDELSKHEDEQTHAHRLLPKFTNLADFLPSSRVTSQVIDDVKYSRSPLGSGNSLTLQSPFSTNWNKDDKCETQFTLTPIPPRFFNNQIDTDKDYLGSISKYIKSSGQSRKAVTVSGEDTSVIHPTTVKASQSHEELQESTAVNAYPDGPANVLDLILYLYSDPFLSEKPVNINDYDLVLNVAKECRNLESEFDASNGKTYVHIPWSHTSSILKDLPEITKKLSEIDKPGKKALIHCQCGVLRSACVIVAYFMVKFNLSVNEAYELLKSGSKHMSESENGQNASTGHFVQACEKICPNMNLIFELMDFGEQIKASNKN